MTRLIILLTAVLALLSISLIGVLYLDQRPHDVAGVISDAESGRALAGARVQVGVRSVQADGSGHYSFTGVTRDTPLSAEAPGYVERNGITVRGLLLEFSWPVDVALQPNVVDGLVTEAGAGPVVDAAVTVDQQSARTSSAGRFTFKRVPAGAMILATADGYSSGNAVFKDGQPVTVTLEPNTLAGTALEAGSSTPVAGAAVKAGSKSGVSDTSGKYTLRGIPRGATVSVTADGYLSATYTFVETETKRVFLSPNQLTGQVTDAETGGPVAGATLREGARSIQADAGGRYTVTKVLNSAVFTATADGFVPAQQPAQGRATLNFAMQPTVVQGRVTDAKTGKAIAGAVVYVDSVSTKTDADGRYTFKRVKRGATVMASAENYGPGGAEIGDSPTIDIVLKPGALSGVVRNSVTGAPLAGATVALDGVFVTTDAAGVYKMGGEMAPGSVLTAKFPGYTLGRVSVGSAGFPNVSLTPFTAKGLYFPFGTVLGDGGAKARALIDAGRPYGINAIVVDVTGDIADDVGRLIYKSASSVAARIGSSRSNSTEIQALLKYAKERNVYTIARIMAFKNDLIARGAPEMAIKRRSNGLPWRDSGGSYWADPYNATVWAYDLFIARECAALGFDEVQFDYIRMPTDGVVSDTYYPSKPAGDTRGAYQIVEGLLRQLPAALPNVYVSVDTFGWTTWETADEWTSMGLGQRLPEMAKYVDYISPMVYPSTFQAGALGFDRPPAHPYEVVYRSTVNAAKRIAKTNAKIRPWIQDFDDYTFGYSYDALQVSVQLKAAEDSGVPGWLIWNPAGIYTQGGWKR